MTHGEEAAFDRGAWAAFNEVLFYLNTLNDATPSKTVLYKQIFEMRPSLLYAQRRALGDSE